MLSGELADVMDSARESGTAIADSGGTFPGESAAGGHTCCAGARRDAVRWSPFLRTADNEAGQAGHFQDRELEVSIHGSVPSLQIQGSSGLQGPLQDACAQIITVCSV